LETPYELDVESLSPASIESKALAKGAHAIEKQVVLPNENGADKLGTSLQIKDYELQAIMTGNTPAGTTWKQIPFSNPDSPNKVLNKAVDAYFGDALGQKMWQRNDGAILWLRSHLIVRLELPVARECEAKLKADKEQKARASVPQF
jgi:hypothetical protein